MIPRTIHQFWDSREPPAEVSDLMVSWRSLNPGWDYRLWCDRTTEELITACFDERTLEAYRDCKFPAMRADISRYLVLYQFGGVYADSDLRCLKPLSSVIDPNAAMFVFRGRIPVWRNDFMGAARRLPLMKTLIEQGIDNVINKSSDNLWKVTGPGMTTPLITRTIESGEVLIQRFQFLDVRNVIIKFNNTLHYRSEGRHWAEAQKKESIYRSGP
jgi:mannosyltransferase OCH1-like enzyme